MFDRISKCASFVFLAYSLACTVTPPGSTPGVRGQEPADPAPKEPRRLALLVGIDRYKSPSIKPLQGAVNDVLRMKNLLTGKFGFPVENVRVLINEEATYEAILGAFQEQLGLAGDGDLVVFHFSGHGSQRDDQDGDEIDDGLDETLVAYDSRMPNVFDISDDQINGLLQGLHTRNVTVIVDCCHSGTAVRGAGRVRRIDKDTRTPPPVPGDLPTARAVADGEADFRRPGLDYALISACRSTQQAREYRIGGLDYGALTYFLTEELETADERATYRDVMDIVRFKVSSRFGNQEPQLEGVAADQAVFGENAILTDPFVPAHPSGSTVRLEAGEIQGITVGSVFEVYPPGTKRFDDPGRVVSRIEITSVLPAEAYGDLASGAQIQGASRAVERIHRYPDGKFRICLEGLSGSRFLRNLKNELQSYHFIETVAEREDYQLLVRLEPGPELPEDVRRVVLEAGDETTTTRLGRAGDPDTLGSAVDMINRWVRWFRVLSLRNPSPKSRIDFKVQARKPDGGTRSPFDNIGQTDATLREDERVLCIVKNKSRDPLYIGVLDLSTDGSISWVYPSVPGAQEPLPAGQTWRRELETFIPDGLESVRDVLKVFATTAPVDFRFLEQGPLRTGQSRDVPEGLATSLGRLLTREAWGTRGARDVELTEWATAQRVIEVRKR